MFHLLFSKFQSIDANNVKFSDNEIVDLLRYGSPKFDTDQNHKTLSSCISFILKSETFNGSLLKEQMEWVDNKTSDLHSCLICQSCKYLLLLLLLLSLLLLLLLHSYYYNYHYYL